MFKKIINYILWILSLIVGFLFLTNKNKKQETLIEEKEELKQQYEETKGKIESLNERINNWRKKINKLTIIVIILLFGICFPVKAASDNYVELIKEADAIIAEQQSIIKELEWQYEQLYNKYEQLLEKHYKPQYGIYLDAIILDDPNISLGIKYKQDHLGYGGGLLFGNDFGIEGEIVFWF